MKDLGKASYILEIKLLQDRRNKTLGLSQASYMNHILARYMHDVKSAIAPVRHR